jgi:hypothetical protein
MHVLSAWRQSSPSALSMNARADMETDVDGCMPTRTSYTFASQSTYGDPCGCVGLLKYIY